MDNDSEKAAAAQRASDDVKGGPHDEDTRIIESFTPEETRRIIRRVDRRLVTTLGAMYCVSLMDRSWFLPQSPSPAGRRSISLAPSTDEDDVANLGAANIAGMAQELLLVGNRYVRLRPILLSVAQNCNRAQAELPRCRAEYRHAGVLHHLHCVPTAIHGHSPEAWSQSPPVCHYVAMGRRHDRHGLCQELGAASGDARSPWRPRGRLLPKLRLPA